MKEKKKKRISINEFERRLVRLFEHIPRCSRARTFKEAGLLTKDYGVVVKLDNNQEFQLIVRELL